jgi:cytochrome b6-f complex iron-sulfur subunit
VKAPVVGRLVLALALGAHAERRHRGVRPVVRGGGRNREPRTAVRAVGERVPVPAIGGIAYLRQAVGARRKVGGDRDAAIAAAVAFEDLEIAGRLERDHFIADRVDHRSGRSRGRQAVHEALNGVVRAERLDRHAPRVVAHAALVAAAVPLTGCAEPPSLPQGAVRVPLHLLADGQRVLIAREDEPVELIRSGSVVMARSLYCTHMGCRVAWDATRQRYLCPCHGGEFDDTGRPVAGIPSEPLHLLPVSLEPDAVVIMKRPA